MGNDGSLPQLSDVELAASVGPELYERLVGRDHVPALYRVLGHSAVVLDGWTRLFWPLRSGSGFTDRHRELVILYVALRAGSRYEWSHHYPIALRGGLTADQLAGLGGWRSGERFDAADRALLEFVDDLLTVDGPRHVAEFTAAHGRRRTVETVALTYGYVFVASVLRALGVAIEPEYAGHAATWPGDRP